MKKKLLFLVPLFFICCKTHVSNEVVVYNNDFESGNLTNVANGIISQYNGSAVLGQYNCKGPNKGYFNVSLTDLPKHDLITISFDLYIHDSWDGNKTAPDGPDIWQMLVDGNTYVYATFSNDPCNNSGFCAPQSYPLTYPNNFSNPKTGAYRTDLPGVCHLAGPNGTTQYKITKTFKHTGSTLKLECSDLLVQTNTADPQCDESWSVDNINIKAITE
jgi:hypothetical protein